MKLSALLLTDLTERESTVADGQKTPCSISDEMREVCVTESLRYALGTVILNIFELLLMPAHTHEHTCSLDFMGSI